MLIFRDYPVNGVIMDSVGTSRNQGPERTEITYNSLSDVYFSSWPKRNPFIDSPWRPIFMAKFRSLDGVFELGRLGVIFRHVSVNHLQDTAKARTFDGEVIASVTGNLPALRHEWDCRGESGISGTLYMAVAPIRETPSNFEIDFTFPTGGLEWALFAYPAVQIEPTPRLTNPKLGKLSLIHI